MPFLNSFSPPTTSLYQSMALSGLVLFMFFKYLRHVTEKAYLAKKRESERVHAVINAKLTHLEKKSEFHKEELEMVRSDKAETFDKEEKLENVNEAREKLLVKYHKLLDLNRQHIDDIQLLRIEASDKFIVNKELDDAPKEYKMAVWYDKTVSLLSLTLAFSGFIMWYIKIQQFQDLILLHQAMK